MVTDLNGNYQFLNLPASNGAGYTLTEQAQATAPLTQYGDGTDTAGTVAARRAARPANDVITGAVLGVGRSVSVTTSASVRPDSSGGTYIDRITMAFAKPANCRHSPA